MKEQKAVTEQEKETKYLAPALDKGLDILEYLSAQPAPQSQTEISLALNKSPNELYRMLMCLENRGYIIRDEVSAKYELSLKMYHLSHRHSPVDVLRKAAVVPMEELAQKVKQSCHLSILHLSEVMVLLHTKSPGPISLTVAEGHLFPLAHTASGKVLTAFMAGKERLNVLSNSASYQKLSTRQQSAFQQLVQKINEEGHYIMQSDLAEGIVDISLPVGQAAAGIHACLTVSGLVNPNSVKETELQKILNEAVLCARKIEKRLGLNQPNGFKMKLP